MDENQLDKLYGLLNDFSTVILITMGWPDGCHARPMAVARVDKNTDLWLFTSRDSDKVRQIEADSRVQVHGQEGLAQIRLASRAKGIPTAVNFTLAETTLPPLQAQQVLVQNLFMTVNPSMRGLASWVGLALVGRPQKKLPVGQTKGEPYVS